MWCAFFTILVAVFDLCALMKHVTMFSEDIFAGLISLIFIIDGVRRVAQSCVLLARRHVHVRSVVHLLLGPSSRTSRRKGWH